MPCHGRLTIETANAHLDEAYAEANDARPGQYVMFAVSDEGTGLSEETVSRAYEPFFTTKDVGKGSVSGGPRCTAS
jgi:C4-dicarboxylate-specific signal transduction histidine kinase